jgi:hypothetical protein
VEALHWGESVFYPILKVRNLGSVVDLMKCGVPSTSCPQTEMHPRFQPPDRSLRSPRFEPVRSCDDLAQEKQKDAEQDDAASNPRARTSFAKSKVPLQPIEQRVQQKEFEQSRKTSLTIAHYTPQSMRAEV